jgi:Pyruvate/2-oxoacid:ferredoxin oxidoreductase delta subunit
MAVRTMVHIDEELCDGCGLCIPGCAEGALQIVDGKAKLVSDIYCDGLGACLGECPLDAITMIEREAEDFDEEAVGQHIKNLTAAADETEPVKEGVEEKPVEDHLGCPGSLSQSFGKEDATAAGSGHEEAGEISSRLGNWPVQIALAPPVAPYFDGADLMIAADCAPFAYAEFHRKMLDGKVVLIGCPKLDDMEFYLQKLTQMFAGNDVKSVEVVFMEVPCCSGIVQVVDLALQQSGKDIETIYTRVGIKGDLLDRQIKSVGHTEVPSAGATA